MRSYVNWLANDIATMEGIGIDKIDLQLNEVPYTLHVDAPEKIYTVAFTILAHDDFTNDGVEDYVVSYDVEGLQGGQLYTLGMLNFVEMKDETQRKDVISMTTDQPCLWYKMDNLKYENKKLVTTITEKRCPHLPPIENPESTILTFAFDGSTLYEEGYRTKCKMAEMTDKTIFRKDLPGKISRSVEMNKQSFLDTASESYTEGDISIAGTLAGCDNLNLVFTMMIDTKNGQIFESESSKSKVLEMMDVLINCTRYKSLMTKMKNSYNKLEYSNTTARMGAFDGIWKYEVRPLQYDENEQTYTCTIILVNEENLHQANLWDIVMKRR